MTCRNLPVPLGSPPHVICNHTGTNVSAPAPSVDVVWSPNIELPDILQAPVPPLSYISREIPPGDTSAGMICPEGYRCTVTKSPDSYQVTLDAVPKVRKLPRIPQTDSQLARKIRNMVLLRAVGGSLAGVLLGLLGIASGYGALSAATNILLTRAELAAMVTESWVLTHGETMKNLLEQMFELAGDAWEVMENVFTRSPVLGLNAAVQEFRMNADMVREGIYTGQGMFLVRGFVNGRTTYAVINRLGMGGGQYNYFYNNEFILESTNFSVEVFNNLGATLNMQGIGLVVEGNVLEVMKYLADHGLVDIDPALFRP